MRATTFALALTNREARLARSTEINTKSAGTFGGSVAHCDRVPLSALSPTLPRRCRRLWLRSMGTDTRILACVLQQACCPLS
jgi:hypothetical protein